ncbi:MAG: DUF4167 domain-containing protein [Pseudomonadota bacterium]
MRGRGRKGPNPLTRTYESNGPDVKIRGTAMHIAEKYQQLARDAQASGDRVMFENYNQHAEHYLRIVAAAQPQQQPAAQPAVRNEAEDGQDAATANGAAPVNGSERPSQDRGSQERVPQERASQERAPQERATSAEGEVVDADSPQPFIEDMPVIDQEGQVNGAGQKADADEAAAEEKPRRRTRTPRARTPRRSSAETSAEEATQATAEAAEPAGDASDEEKPKPRRRTTRPRRTKAAEEAPAEAAAPSE